MIGSVQVTGQLIFISTVIVLLALSAFFSGSETALFAVSHSSISGEGGKDPKKGRVARLLKRPRMLLVTILFGNLLVNISNTSIVTAFSIERFGERGVGYSMIAMTILILMFGEITPKSVALRHSQKLAPAFAPVLSFMMYVFTPVRLILGMLADFTVEKSRALFGERREEYRSLELAEAVEMAHQDGIFDEFERMVLTNLFLFTETAVHEIHVPRGEVFSLSCQTDLQDATRQVREQGFTRIPLYGENTEDIIGVIHAKDLLRSRKDPKATLQGLMRPARFVPETKKIRDLFGELISEKQHLAVVVDEHGSFEGIITLEDIIEEIFGEIRDRREPRVEDFNLLDRDNIVVEGSMEIDDFNEYFDTALDSSEVETIGGYLTEQIGKIPREGETFILDGLRFLVISAERTRVNKLKIERIVKSGEGDEHL